MLLTEDGLVKICDLGLACAAQAEASMTRRGHAHVHVAREGAQQALRLRRRHVGTRLHRLRARDAGADVDAACFSSAASFV
jgi:hypothetical protein